MSDRVVKNIQKLIVILFGACIIVPLILVGLKSVSVAGEWHHIIPKQISFRAWETIFSDPLISQSIWKTMQLSVAVIILNLLIAYPAAYALAYYDFKGKAIFELLLMMPIVVPLLAATIGIHLALIKIGLAYTFRGVVLVHLIPTVPYSIKLLKDGFVQTGIKYQYVPTVLGASILKRFFYVTLPMHIESIKGVMTLTFLISYSQYAITAIVGGGIIITMPMIYYPYFNSAVESTLAAFSLLFALIAGIVVIVINILCGIIYKLTTGE